MLLCGSTATTTPLYDNNPRTHTHARSVMFFLTKQAVVLFVNRGVLAFYTIGGVVVVAIAYRFRRSGCSLVAAFAICF